MAKQLDATDFIKPFEAPEEAVEDIKPKKPTPFAFITAVSETKKDIIKEDPDLKQYYNSYITNRGFSYFPDSVLHANEMNLHPNIPSLCQYYYYMGSLRKRKRFSKWHKLEKNDDLLMIQKVYGVRADIAKQYLKLLSEENLAELRKLTVTGEDTKKSK